MLDGLRVLDLADASGYVCGRTLADLGADVVKVERPGGDPGRWEPPFAADVPAFDRSLAWLAGNTNKRGITCDLDTPAGHDLFVQLCGVADVVVESVPPRRLDYAVLRESNRGLIYTTITPFGWDGPLAEIPAGDLEVTASSGSLWLAGDPGATPVRSTLPQSAAWAGMYAAMGTLMAVLARDAWSDGQGDGQGQHVDVSAQASMVTAISHAPIFWDLLGEEQHRGGPFLEGRSVTGAKFRNIWPCRDGYVTFALYGGPAGRYTSRELVAWIDEASQPGGVPLALKSVNWETFDPTRATQAEVDALEAEIAPFIRGLTKDEFFVRFVERNMLGYKVSTVEDILSDPQLAAREFWQQVQPAWDDQPFRFPRSFGLFDGVRPVVKRLAPAVGEHTAEVVREWLGR